jgi:DNA polymerase
MGLAAHDASVLLEWYKAMGVDEAIAEVPQDWFAPVPAVEPAPGGPSQAAAPAAPRPPQERNPLARREPVPAVSVPPVAPEAADIMAARELAHSASNLAELRALLENFEGCGLKRTASRLCLSRGSPDASIMLIGEAPGKDEDAKGLPFVGRAGQLLDRMLAAVGLSEKEVYITNLVFWRPPGNRVPSPEEVQVCRPFVERQIELVSPRILVFLGNAAAKELTGASEGILKLRGKWLAYKGIRAMATLHPAYLLRNPIAKRLAWRDLLALREALDPVIPHE